MNIALILAGGTDSRFKMDIPKQFVNVNNRPIIVYTLEAFQNHPEIDEIIVTCLDGWQEMVRAYGKQFNISKLKNIISGGRDAQESTYKGLQQIKSKMDKGDIVVVHDAIRPMVTEEIISKSIDMCRKKGMGVAATPIPFFRHISMLLEIISSVTIGRIASWTTTISPLSILLLICCNPL